jgi:hypothetical protein
MVNRFMLCCVVVRGAGVVVVVALCRECRAREHHQKQYSCKNLFHGLNVARSQ